ncbi:MAG: hypothetical protein ACLFP8_08440 [Alphaproteobacteria bacterium]
MNKRWLKKHVLPIIYTVFAFLIGYGLFLGFYWLDQADNSIRNPSFQPNIPVDVLLIGHFPSEEQGGYVQYLQDEVGEGMSVYSVDGAGLQDLNMLLLPLEAYREHLSVSQEVSGGIFDSSLAEIYFALRRYEPYIVVLQAGGYQSKDIETQAGFAVTSQENILQILMQIKAIYGDDTFIVVAGGYAYPESARFNTVLQELVKKQRTYDLRDISYLDMTPLARIGWFSELGLYYDHNSFPSDRSDFDTIHTAEGRLNEQGYLVFAKLLACPLRNMFKKHEWRQKGDREDIDYLHLDGCSVLKAGDLNSSLANSN